MISSNQIYKDKQYCTLCGNSGKVIESVYGFKTEIVDCYGCALINKIMQLGTRIRTTKENQQVQDWNQECRKCKWGITGTIIRSSDSHGLCYEVMHDEIGTTAWYDRSELSLL